MFKPFSHDKISSTGSRDNAEVERAGAVEALIGDGSTCINPSLLRSVVLTGATLAVSSPTQNC